MNLIEKIGMPALLELCAEECNELAHACLKFSRKIRNENPTPKSEEECIEELIEEMADVQLCMGLLVHNTDDISVESIESWLMFKENRMKERLMKEV